MRTTTPNTASRTIGATVVTQPPALIPGTPVEVRTSLSTWGRGFRVVRAGTAGYVVCRQSDGRVLPREFGPDQVRPA